MGWKENPTLNQRWTDQKKKWWPLKADWDWGYANGRKHTIHQKRAKDLMPDYLDYRRQKAWLAGWGFGCLVTQHMGPNASKDRLWPKP